MKKKLFVVLGVAACVGIYAWISSGPSTHKGSDVVSRSAHDKPLGRATDSNSKGSENSMPQPEISAPETPIPVKKLTQGELDNLQSQVKQRQQEMNQLALTLNENLENPAERKQIEEKYSKITEQYNQLALQIIKQKNLEEKEAATNAE